MRQITTYCCEFCEATFKDKTDCQVHEAQHLGLTKELYLMYKDLRKEVRATSFAVCCNSNPETRQAQDEAIQKLIDFEQEHNFTQEELPTDFYI